MNRIKVDLERRCGLIDRNLFGGFIEHLGRGIYGGIYDPDSPFADEQGFRSDVLNALCRLQMPIIRYPGGNFVSGYRWMDGVGPREERSARVELAWGAVEPNQFGTNEFIEFCRKVSAEPYIVVNCGDGDMREARDWVEYCNGTQDTSLVKLRRQHGYPAPHQVKYWGIGNEVDGGWQIGFKTAAEYARAYREFAKVMRWVDPSIQLIASGISSWSGDFIERAQLLLEHAADYIDYFAIHWYVGNRENNFANYMAVSELIEEQLSACSGLIRALGLQRKQSRLPALAVDEWNVWYRTHSVPPPDPIHQLEEIYNLEDALAVAIQLNAFLRHANSVRMANLAQLVNVIGPIFTSPQGLVLQTIFFPFELYSRTCGNISLEAFWTGETFDSGLYGSVRVLDVSATLNERQKSLSIYVVNRSATEPMETTVTLDGGYFAGHATAFVVNGPDIKAENTFSTPNEVKTIERAYQVDQQTSFAYTFEPHSVTALVFSL